MNEHKAVIPGLLAAFFLICLTILIVKSLSYSDSDREKPAQKLSNAVALTDDRREQVTLPHSFRGLPARTAVTVKLDVTPKDGDFLYVKSVYAPLRIFAGDELLYEYGEEGSYPSFMQDPATAVALVRLPLTEGETIHLRLEYLSPSARSTLTVHQMLLGSQTAIYRRLFQEMGFSFVFSVVLIFGGLFLIMIALFVLGFERKGMAFAWLGLFALAVGAWTFGECNLTGLLIRNPTFLYLLAFSGMFILAAPLLLFGITVVDFHNQTVLKAAAYTITATTAAALLLQLTGTVSLSKSMYLFHVLEPLVLCMFASHILYESLHYHSASALRFLVPIAVLALFSILEVVNYSVHITYILSLFFQIGVLIFIVMDGVIGGRFVRDAFRLREEEQRLRYEMELMEYSMEEQKKHQKLFLQNQETVRAQRHDLRHQLTVLRSFSENGETERLNEYINSLISAIPTERGRSYCENAAVNAIVSHYAAQAEELGTELTIRLSIPEKTEQIPDSSLCVILGNLLENAVEACERMTEGKRFIRLSSRLQYGTLTITMDNSFDGKTVKRNGRFISSKRDEVGTGLRSVTAMAEKFGGGTNFETEGTVFLSSVYVQI